VAQIVNRKNAPARPFFGRPGGASRKFEMGNLKKSSAMSLKKTSETSIKTRIPKVCPMRKNII
jgi:hypothetical protein